MYANLIDQDGNGLRESGFRLFTGFLRLFRRFEMTFIAIALKRVDFKILILKVFLPEISINIKFLRYILVT
jgi:hypothetical protein